MKTAKTIAHFELVLLLFGYVALSPLAHALNPAPDGGYPNFNTAEGDNALFGLTSGFYNTAIGYWSLYSAGGGNFNTGVGAAALIQNTGNENTATGAGALLLNSTGVGNTADGAFALIYNSRSYYNTAVGDGALQYNTGGWNTAVGIKQASIRLMARSTSISAREWRALLANWVTPTSVTLTPPA